MFINYYYIYFKCTYLNRDFMEICLDPEYGIMVACAQITPELAESYFKKSLGFNF